MEITPSSMQFMESGERLPHEIGNRNVSIISAAVLQDLYVYCYP
jgi:hypothetical protein